MKRLLIFFLAIVAMATATYGAGEGPVLKFDNMTYDFGTIDPAKGPVTAIYTFTNTGNKPLVIVSVSNGGCGCTTPKHPREPIAPGKSGTITITFDPTGRRGELLRMVKVKSNAINGKRMNLKFTGMLVPSKK